MRNAAPVRDHRPSAGDMPFDAATKSMRLFAAAVLPAVHEIDVAVSP
jgi:hypothetical protein